MPTPECNTLLLERLDLLMHRETLRMRTRDSLSLDELRGLYVSDRQVDALLVRRANAAVTMPSEDLTRQIDALTPSALRARAEDPQWLEIARVAELTAAELDVLSLGLSVECDPKYETLFAYLNNDVSRRYPTCDLALRLFTSNLRERNGLRARLQPDSPLFRTGLLLPVAAPRERPSVLASGFSLAVPAVRYLLGLPAQLGRVNAFTVRSRPAVSWDEVSVAPDLRFQLLRLAALEASLRPGQVLPTVIVEGGSGSAALPAVDAFCAQCDLPLLTVNLGNFHRAAEPPECAARCLELEQKLERSVILIIGADKLFEDGSRLDDSRALLDLLLDAPGPLFLYSDKRSPVRDIVRGRRVISFTFNDPDFEQRADLWERFSTEANCPLDPDVRRDLAARFVLNSGQIRNALAVARDSHYLSGANNGHLSPEEIFLSARNQSDKTLGNLAAPVRDSHGWDDLVLPPVTLRQAREVASAIRNRERVYGDWGFGRRLAAGKGLKVLFSGPAGTGKTLTAGIIAADLGLSLYKIDLSGIVSKFIGDTEKNLDRVFEAARCASAILFFDEADALFGKRSEVKDAHDRYANIEVAYLLQKMEDYDGPVILASNLSKNMDGAFARRMHYVLEFPMPNPAQRVELWRKMFPREAPLASDIDFHFLAEQFPIAGGDIRNVALAAAFLAARGECVIRMTHIVQALSRQLLKQGKAPGTAEFKQYRACLATAD